MVSTEDYGGTTNRQLFTFCLHFTPEVDSAHIRVAIVKPRGEANHILRD